MIKINIEELEDLLYFAEQCKNKIENGKSVIEKLRHPEGYSNHEYITSIKTTLNTLYNDAEKLRKKIEEELDYICYMDLKTRRSFDNTIKNRINRIKETSSNNNQSPEKEKIEELLKAARTQLEEMKNELYDPMYDEYIRKINYIENMMFENKFPEGLYEKGYISESDYEAFLSIMLYLDIETDEYLFYSSFYDDGKIRVPDDEDCYPETLYTKDGRKIKTKTRRRNGEYEYYIEPLKEYFDEDGNLQLYYDKQGKKPYESFQDKVKNGSYLEALYKYLDSDIKDMELDNIITILNGINYAENEEAISFRWLDLYDDEHDSEMSMRETEIMNLFKSYAAIKGYNANDFISDYKLYETIKYMTYMGYDDDQIIGIVNQTFEAIESERDMDYEVDAYSANNKTQLDKIKYEIKVEAKEKFINQYINYDAIKKDTHLALFDYAKSGSGDKTGYGKNMVDIIWAQHYKETHNGKEPLGTYKDYNNQYDYSYFLDGFSRVGASAIKVPRPISHDNNYFEGMIENLIEERKQEIKDYLKSMGNALCQYEYTASYYELLASVDKTDSKYKELCKVDPNDMPPDYSKYEEIMTPEELELYAYLYNTKMRIKRDETTILIMKDVSNKKDVAEEVYGYEEFLRVKQDELNARKGFIDAYEFIRKHLTASGELMTFDELSEEEQQTLLEKGIDAELYASFPGYSLLALKGYGVGIRNFFSGLGNNIFADGVMEPWQYESSFIQYFVTNNGTGISGKTAELIYKFSIKGGETTIPTVVGIVVGALSEKPTLGVAAASALIGLSKAGEQYDLSLYEGEDYRKARFKSALLGLKTFGVNFVLRNFGTWGESMGIDALGDKIMGQLNEAFALMQM